MSPPLPCCLFTVRFQSDLGSQMALCGCATHASFLRAASEAFSHPLYSRLDESSRHERIAHSLERALLSDAGVASVSAKAKEQNFFVDNAPDPIRSSWVEISLAGKINARKARVVESVLRSWLEEVFPHAHCALPSARPIPIGNQSDMGALGAGWRAEAYARGFPSPPLAASSNPESFAAASEDGFPLGTRGRRKK